MYVTKNFNIKLLEKEGFS